jgi:Protein of unknown function (DUF3570)
MKPTVCRYQQTTAYFYTPWIYTTASQIMTDDSADSRLGTFHALPYGAKFAVRLDGQTDQPGSPFSMRTEYYQHALDNGVARAAALQRLDSYFGLKAILIHLACSY